MDLTTVAKTDFQFCGMRVDVDELGIEGEIQNVGRVASPVENIPIGEAYCIHQQAVPHIAIVHKPELLVRLPTRRGGQPDPT